LFVSEAKKRLKECKQIVFEIGQYWYKNPEFFSDFKSEGKIENKGTEKSYPQKPVFK